MSGVFSYFPNTALLKGAHELCLTPNESHHLLKVLRKREGDEVVLFDGIGHTRRGFLLEGHSKNGIRIGKFFPMITHTRQFKITLVQALPNEASVVEDLLRKITELGVHTFSPVISERTEERRWTSDKRLKKMDRWRQITIEACKQSKNPFLPMITSVDFLTNYLDGHTFSLVWYGSLSEAARPLLTWLKEAFVHDLFQQKNLSLALVIGPEGGFSKEEDAYLRSKNALPLKLSSYVLRVETAAVMGLGCLQQISMVIT